MPCAWNDSMNCSSPRLEAVKLTRDLNDPKRIKHKDQTMVDLLPLKNLQMMKKKLEINFDMIL